MFAILRSHYMKVLYHIFDYHWNKGYPSFRQGPASVIWGFDVRGPSVLRKSNLEAVLKTYPVRYSVMLMELSNSPAFSQAKRRTTVIFKVCCCFHHRREEDWLCLFSHKKSTDWISFTPFLSDLYYVWKLHSKRKRLDKNSKKFQFVFPGIVQFKKRLKCTLGLSWKYYARGLHSNISLSYKTKYHYNIYIHFFPEMKQRLMPMATNFLCTSLFQAPR